MSGAPVDAAVSVVGTLALRVQSDSSNLIGKIWGPVYYCVDT